MTAATHRIGERVSEVKPFPEMLSAVTDPNLAVFQVTTDPDGAFTENCPILAPDLKTVFFNSDWTGKIGRPQVFAVRGFQFPEG